MTVPVPVIMAVPVIMVMHGVGCMVVSGIEHMGAAPVSLIIVLVMHMAVAISP